MTNSAFRLPAIIAGPLLRHINCHELTFWLVTTDNYPLHFYLYQQDNGQLLLSRLLSDAELQRIPIGKHAFINLIHIRFENSLPENTIFSYDFGLIFADKIQTLHEIIPDLAYPGNQRPTFAIKSNIQKILHGSS